MKLYVTLILLSNFLINSYPAPIKPQINEEDPELTAGFYDGDMIIQIDRNGVVDVLRTWPLGIVYYKIDEVFNEDQISYIQQAMAAIESVSCVFFLPATNDTESYVMITGKDDGCYATVGYSGVKNILNLKLFDLDKGCFIKGKIMHELLHVLGFYHQQSAVNRDDYVLIVTENLIDGRESPFRKLDNNTVTDFDTPYDYESIMHYGPKAFSKNGEDTIITLQQNVTIGQREGLSQTDIYKINLMYNCHISEVNQSKLRGMFTLGKYLPKKKQII